MKPFELMLVYQALAFLEQLSSRERGAAGKALETLKTFPHNCKDRTEKHFSGREYFVFLRGNYAITFWIDEWEREVKVVDIQVRQP